MPRKFHFFLEILFFVGLCLPYPLIIFGMTHSGPLFSLFPLGLSILLPIGALILYLELTLVKRKIKADSVIVVLCAIDIGFGALGWLMFLLIAVT
jgi:hypothetical protein